MEHNMSAVMEELRDNPLMSRAITEEDVGRTFGEVIEESMASEEVPEEEAPTGEEEPVMEPGAKKPALSVSMAILPKVAGKMRERASEMRRPPARRSPMAGMCE